MGKSIEREHPVGWLESEVTRRSFIKAASVLAGGVAFGTTLFHENAALAENFGNPVLVETDGRVDIKYSICLACHNACGIRCKVVDGILVKIDGNPYHPNAREDHLSYATEPAEARTQPARICAKGQSGIQVVYDPLRIKEPLKRVEGTARGAGQWQAISWEQAFSEIGEQLTALRDLENPIDAAAPELGPAANRVVFSGGRNQHGQKEFTDRFWGDSFGTVNKRHDHTSICETSHHVAYQFATGKTKGSTDLPSCEFVLWFGSDPCSANFPFLAQSRKLIDMLQRGGKLAVVDPRFNVAASKADWWLPVIPGTDAALALAIGRYIIDNNLHNTAFLQRPHGDAANPTGELNVTDATYLVKIENGHATAYLRADEAGIEGGTANDFVVWSDGAAAQYNSVDAGELLPGVVDPNGITCKTAFQLYADAARSRTLDDYEAVCDIDAATVQAIATELTSHGRKVSVEHYRGSVQHTNGTYTAWAIINLNTLVGNYNWQGGHVFGGGHWHETGGKSGNPYTPTTVVGGVSNSGVRITRAKAFYQDSAEFAAGGYPAQRPWFPFAFNLNYQEIVPSIEDEYPYSIGALILYWNNIAYSTPAGKAAVERVLADESKVPLIVSIDILMGETTAFADYILPDSTYLERWSTPHVGSAINTKVSGIRQPVVGSNMDRANYTPVLPETKTMEDILIGLGNAMDLPIDGQDVSMISAWDWHRQLVANIALEDPGVAATEEDAIEYVLARGGRFEDHRDGLGLYDGDMMAHRHSGQMFFFNEELAQTADSITGELYDGFAKYAPVADSGDNPIDDGDAFPLKLITYKQAWHSMARTINNPWLVSIMQENFVEMNSVDAAYRGIGTGDLVRVTSPSLPEGVTGRARVTETIRPSVVAIAHSFGHWEMGSKSYEVDGAASDFDATRGAGIAANPLMRTDPQLGNVALQDKIGGSVSFYDTFVEVTKA